MKKIFKNMDNLKKMYVIKALRSGMFSIAVVVIFFQQNGLSMQQITLLQALFALAVILLEVPTGYFADHYGRKESIVIGSIFSTLGYLVYSFASGFTGFLAGEILLAFGYCFVSGADGAIIYENSDASSENKRAIKAEGNGASATMFSEGVTSFIGGTFLAAISLRMPLYFDVLLALSVLPFALSLENGERIIPQKRENAIKKMWRVMKYSLHQHTEIKWLIIYSAVVSTSTLTMVWFIQIYLMAAKVPVYMFGTIWAGLMLVGACVSYKVHDIETYLGRKKSLIALIVMPVLGYVMLGVGASMWSILFICLFYFTRGMNDPILKCYINGNVTSEDRSTILSVQSLIGRLMFVVVGPIAGWINDTYSLQATFMWCAGLFSVLGLFGLIMLKRHKAL